MKARDIEPFNSFVQNMISIISHRMNFDQNDDEDEESEKANTPFEDATKLLKYGLNVDRVQALDSFLLNSCLVHDMTVVTDCLFGGEEEDTSIKGEQVMKQEFSNIAELNDRSDKITGTTYDGYFYLGRGFLSLKMGRVHSGFRDITAAVNS